MEVKVKRMTTYEVSDDGDAVTLNFVGEDDAEASLRLQIPDLGNLSMTLPSLIEAALRRRHRAGSFRYAYPIGSWSIEQAIDPGSVIVTLRTSDGFGISFSMERGHAAKLSQSLSDVEIEQNPGAVLAH